MKLFAKLPRSFPQSYRASTGWTYRDEVWDVRVMAIAEGYAMVRRKGCLPFVVSEKELILEKPTKELQRA